jgi:CHAD domain-containing protein
MENGSRPSHTPGAVETASSADAAIRAGAMLDHEETCKKVRDLALRHLNRFISYESKVLKGDDANAIHDMRVASRRLQQVLDLLYLKPRPQELRRLRRQICRCRRALGEVRNCDVLLDFVRRSLGRKRSARREAWTAVQQFLLVRRSETFLRATHKLGKINLTVFYVNLKAFLHQEKAAEHTAEHHAHGAAASRARFAGDMTNALQSAWSRFEGQIEHSRRSPRPEIIHGTRIATKRLRYLLEVFHEFGVPGCADALSWLRQLQNHLGDWHDLEVLEQVIIEMVARPDFLRDHLTLAMEVEKLILRNRASKAKIEQTYLQAFRDSEDVRRLKEWISYLLASPSTALVSS